MKQLLICVLGLTLAGCSSWHHSDQSAHNFDGGMSAACTNDPYLQKYQCSPTKIQQAAESGDPDAQYALGYLYYYGIGLTRDPQAGVLWIQHAAGQGQRLARQALLMINSNQSFGPYSGSTVRSSGGSSYHQPRANVNAMNARMPDQPVQSHLPAFGNSAVKRPAALKSLQSTSPMATEQGDGVAPTKPSSLNTPAFHHQSYDPRMQQGSVPNAAYQSLSVRKPRSSESMRGMRSTVASQKPHHQVSSMGLSATEQALLKVAPSAYTIQLMGSHNLRSIEDFSQRYNMQGAVHYYLTRFQGKPWYMLVYGEYTNASLARQALRKLPRFIREQHPWIKSFKVVRKEIRARRLVS